MPIISSDIQKRYSVAAAVGDTAAGTASTSLGDQISTTQITDDSFGNVFPNTPSDEATAGVVRYRCIFILNNHDSLTLVDPNVSIQSQISGGATVALGVDPTEASDKGSGTAQALTIANETTAPPGVSFGTGPTPLGDLGPSQTRAIWLRETVPPGATPPAPGGTDNFVLLIDGDTLP